MAVVVVILISIEVIGHTIVLARGLNNGVVVEEGVFAEFVLGGEIDGIGNLIVVADGESIDGVVIADDGLVGDGDTGHGGFLSVVGGLA